MAQVRNDLPPEAEAPVIELETADERFAAMYLGFSSRDLDQNQITDYLTRVVQPRLSAISGVQRAEILGGRTFAMRIWLKPDRMAARGISPSDVQRALAANNYLSAVGHTKGAMTSVNLIANTDLKSPEEFRRWWSRRARAAWCASATSPKSCSAPRTTTRRCASTARRRPSWASGCCPPPTPSTSSAACARRCRRSRPASLPA